MGFVALLRHSGPQLPVPGVAFIDTSRKPNGSRRGSCSPTMSQSTTFHRRMRIVLRDPYGASGHRPARIKDLDALSEEVLSPANISDRFTQLC
jgi:hypothetical protein